MALTSHPPSRPHPTPMHFLAWENGRGRLYRCIVLSQMMRDRRPSYEARPALKVVRRTFMLELEAVCSTTLQRAIIELYTWHAPLHNDPLQTLPRAYEKGPCTDIGLESPVRTMLGVRQATRGLRVVAAEFQCTLTMADHRSGSVGGASRRQKPV